MEVGPDLWTWEVSSCSRGDLEATDLRACLGKGFGAFQDMSCSQAAQGLQDGDVGTAQGRVKVREWERLRAVFWLGVGGTPGVIGFLSGFPSQERGEKRKKKVLK